MRRAACEARLFLSLRPKNAAASGIEFDRADSGPRVVEMNATGNVGEERGVASGRGGHPRESHRECFACGIGQGGGLRLHFEVGADGLARAIWVPEAVFRSYPDRVHGGVVATLLDSAMVHALFARGAAGVTAELTIRYRHPVLLAGEVEVRGWVDGERHGIFLCGAEARQGGRLAVRAAAKFVAMDPLPNPA